MFCCFFLCFYFQLHQIKQQERREIQIIFRTVEPERTHRYANHFIFDDILIDATYCATDSCKNNTGYVDVRWLLKNKSFQLRYTVKRKEEGKRQNPFGTFQDIL